MFAGVSRHSQRVPVGAGGRPHCLRADRGGHARLHIRLHERGFRGGREGYEDAVCDHQGLRLDAVPVPDECESRAVLRDQLAAYVVRTRPALDIGRS